MDSPRTNLSQLVTHTKQWRDLDQVPPLLYEFTLVSKVIVLLETANNQAANEGVSKMDCHRNSPPKIGEAGGGMTNAYFYLLY